MAGKHVLCEKPLGSNADEVRQMLSAAKASGKVLMEAFHYRFHPLAHRMTEIVASGELGRILRIETEGSIPGAFFADTDIRFSNRGEEPRLAGGALMDIGCYAVNCLRMLAGAEPTVLNATATERFPGVDAAIVAHVALPGGATGRVTASLSAPLHHLFRARATVVGERATLFVENFIGPFAYHYLEVRPAGAGAARTERVYGGGETTYELQLRAFARAVAAGGVDAGAAGSAEDAERNMAAIDAVYRAAGLPIRVGFT